MADALPFLLAGACTSPLWLVASLHLRRRHRLLSDLPTAKASGVFVGLVELKGTAESAAPLRSYLTEQPCVHYAWRVTERWSRLVTETYTDSKGRPQMRTRHESGSTTVAEGGETQAFYLRDDTGVVLVRPADAKIEPTHFFSETVARSAPLYYAKGPPGAIPDSDHVRTFTEVGVALHAPLYVVGQARERTDIVAPEIAASRDAALFLISTRSEENVLRGYAGWSWLCWALGLAGASLGGWALAEADSLARLPPPAAAALAGGLFVCLWILGWVWMVYNSLISLRERVRQGWSLIDIQLKRRHDLIPNLVAAVAGLSSHEREVQTALAALRTQAVATAPGLAGPDHTGLAAIVRIVAEKYPALTAHPQFAELHRELVSTEQRIALARTYYNDLVTYFATRLERVPECWVARLGRMRAPPLLQGEAFERAPVVVDFTP